jgi:hypothetical protein
MLLYIIITLHTESSAGDGVSPVAAAHDALAGLAGTAGRARAAHTVLAVRRAAPTLVAHLGARVRVALKQRMGGSVNED